VISRRFGFMAVRTVAIAQRKRDGSSCWGHRAGRWVFRIVVVGAVLAAGVLASSPPALAAVGTTTTVMSSQNPSVFGQPVTFTATVTPVSGTGTPSGTVTFLDAGTTQLGTATLNGSRQATFTTSTLAVGSHTITADYGGDSNFNASNGPLNNNPQYVNHASTTTALASSANPSVFGQSVTFTATVSAVAPGAGIPSGSVTFLDGTTPLGPPVALNASGQATFTTSGLTVGNHTITATYAGSQSYNSGSGALSGNPQVVNLPSPATTVTSSDNPSVFGEAVTFTATITASAPGAGTPTGTVTFLDGMTQLGTATLNASGQATFTTSTLAVGNHTITVSYSGDAHYNASVGALTGDPQVIAPPSAPTSTSPPAITGTTTQGQTLSTSDGLWLYNVGAFRYQWQRCKPACADIAGATGRSYTLTAADLDARIRALVTATNSAGSTRAASTEVGPITPPPSQIKATLLTQLAPAGHAAKIATLLKNGGYTFSFKAPSSGRVVIDWYYLPKGAKISKAKPKPVLVAAGRGSSSKAGRVKLTIKLTGSGRQMLKHTNRLKLTSEGTFTPTGKTAIIASKTITLAA
jgi:hypothetical protein